MKPVGVGLIDSRHMLKDQREKIGNNQERYPPLDEVEVVALNLAIKKPVEKPTPNTTCALKR